MWQITIGIATGSIIGAMHFWKMLASILSR